MSELERRTAAPEFWEDAEGARAVMQEINDLKNWVEPWEEAHRRAVSIPLYPALSAAEAERVIRTTVRAGRALESER